MYLVQLKSQYQLTEIADYFGLSPYGGVSCANGAVKAELETSSGSIYDPETALLRQFKLMLMWID